MSAADLRACDAAAAALRDADGGGVWLCVPAEAIVTAADRASTCADAVARARGGRAPPADAAPWLAAAAAAARRAGGRR